MMRREHWALYSAATTQQCTTPDKVQTCCRICDLMSLYETLTWLVFSHVLIVSSEASISALILFSPFAGCFLEHGLPVAMQNILALSYCFPKCNWIQIINHSKTISKKIMRKKGWIMKVNRKLSFELKLLKEVKHKLKKKKWKHAENVL